VAQQKHASCSTVSHPIQLSREVLLFADLWQWKSGRQPKKEYISHKFARLLPHLVPRIAFDVSAIGFLFKMFYPRQPDTSNPYAQVVEEQASWVWGCIAEDPGMMGINLEEDVNWCKPKRRQVHGLRVFSASRTTKIPRGFPSGVAIKPMSMTQQKKTAAYHFLKLGCAKLIRPIYAQLHRSNSPSYRRAV